MPAGFDAPSTTPELYRALWEYAGGSVYRELLAPWVRRVGLAARLAPVAEPFARQPAARAWREHGSLRELSWELYALGRVADVLLLAHEPEPPADALVTSAEHREPIANPPVAVNLEEIVATFEQLGMRVRSESGFHPFFHEIVALIEDDAAGAPTIARTHWPCLMLGELLFVRAGVSLRCSRAYACRPWADASTLFWAHMRRNRSTADLALGWGSNSQWRTRFRRDYASPQAYVFNADGHTSPEGQRSVYEPPDPMPRETREQLLVHRCLLRAPPAASDPWPYDWTLALPVD